MVHKIHTTPEIHEKVLGTSGEYYFPMPFSINFLIAKRGFIFLAIAFIDTDFCISQTGK